MVYHASSLAELTRMRARGQRPAGAMVVVGEAQTAAWARRNDFAFVAIGELGGEHDAFAGLNVVVRMRGGVGRHRENLQRLALTATIVVIHDLTTRYSEMLAA